MSSVFKNKNFSDGIFASIKNIKGIGPKSVETFKTKYGVRIIDILLNLPTRYVDRFKNTSIKNCKHGEIITTDVIIVEFNVKKSFYKKKLPSKIITFGLNNESSQRLDIIYFNLYSSNISKNYKLNKQYTISGKFEIFRGVPQITHPHYFIPIDEKYKIPKLDPVYFLPQGIKKNQFISIVNAGIKELESVEEWLSKETLKKFNFLSLYNTLKNLHMPNSKDYEKYKIHLNRRLAFDELISNFISLKILNSKVKSENSEINENNFISKFLKYCGLVLTHDQNKVINEISFDLRSNRPMMRLLQGDVGSGKTIVAMSAMFEVASCGYQATLMVPTEILAKQHYNNFKDIFNKLGMEVVLVLSKNTLQEKKENYEKIYSGKARLIIGTHSLISPKITYNNLKLAIVDEQHRFGVNQRISIVEKGKNVNLLVMTATPIPRSLALTYYDNMSISNIKTKPKGRQKIITSIISKKNLIPLISGIKRKIKNGSQVYWICPSIETNKEVANMISVEERYDFLLKYFDNSQLEIIHGKQKPIERDKKIEKFKKGSSKILISTTVIEVGIDVPEADIIIIENANRYGLAQLHQLRGRVGRGNKQSNCILLYEDNLSEIAEKRLKTLKHNNDGFKIAEKDLLLRGPGEVLGTRQSGENNFRFFNITLHSDLIETAKSEAEILYSDFEENQNKINKLIQIYQNIDILISLGG